MGDVTITRRNAGAGRQRAVDGSLSCEAGGGDTRHSVPVAKDAVAGASDRERDYVYQMPETIGLFA